MRVLGHLHTFNDDDVIDASLAALLGQTWPLDQILIVDNGSTDRTLERSFPEKVVVLRHRENLGTSGAVASGFEYALAHGFDWIWLFDADSAPHPDALEKLLTYYLALPPEERERTWRLSSLSREVRPHLIHNTGARLALRNVEADEREGARHGITFTARGYRVAGDGAAAVYECDATIWSGSLYRLSAVRRVGIPSRDYVLDWGEYEYGYRGKKAGLRGVVHTGSRFDHNIGGAPAIRLQRHAVGPLRFNMIELPAFRCYYVCRNLLYFWLYEYERRNVHTLGPRLWKILALFLNFAVRPRTHHAEAVACLRGMRDGLLGRLERRY